VVRRSVLLTNEGKISVSTLPWEITNATAGESYQSKSVENSNNTTSAPSKDTKFDLKDTASKAEYEAIMSVLKEVNFNKTKAAELLKIDRKTLYNKIKNYEESQ
jgi:two-component system response regulator HydG